MEYARNKKPNRSIRETAVSGVSLRKQLRGFLMCSKGSAPLARRKLRFRAFVGGFIPPLQAVGFYTQQTNKKIIATILFISLVLIVGCIPPKNSLPEIIWEEMELPPNETSNVETVPPETSLITEAEENVPEEAPIVEIRSPEMNVTINDTAEIFPPQPLIIEEPLTFEEKVWKERIDAALAPSDCKPISRPAFGESYDGKLIDTHYHIADIPDSSPGDNEDEILDDSPVLGKNIKITDIVCTLQQENTAKIFAFFPVYPEIPEQMIEVAKKTMERYPETFVPFIMPPDHDNDQSGSSTVSAVVLQEMLAIYPELFQGYGEIGLYEREDGAAELPPDAPRLLDIYPVVRDHHLVVYFHLGEGHKDNFERVLQQNPDINFIWHGDQLISYGGGRQNLNDVEDILSNHPNVYYTIDELYGDIWMIKPDKTKEEFLTYLQGYKTLLEKDLNTWKAAIERHPDQFMWGTDRSDQVLWSHDPEVGQALASYGRAFIARLDPAVQEKFAYKNAERLIEMSGKDE